MSIEWHSLILGGKSSQQVRLAEQYKKGNQLKKIASWSTCRLDHLRTAVEKTYRYTSLNVNG